MNAARMINDCARFELALTAYADGELDPGHAVDLEAHLRQCGACFEQVMLIKATRASLRRTTARRCPDMLRARVAAAIAREQECEEERPEAAPRMIPKRYVAGFAAAAGVAIAFAAWQRAGAPEPEARPRPQHSDVMITAASVESLLDDLVTQHAQPLPPETTNPEDLPRFDPFVGVPVRRPKFQPFRAHFNGARVHSIRDRRAALLQYTVSGSHRVTVYLFNSRQVPVKDAPVLRPRIVRERPVYVGRINGYSVAAAEHSGVGYALATDMGDEESTQLVLAAMQ
jgi:anti-sigma factor RsiW